MTALSSNMKAANSAPIGSEDTLKMLMQAIKSETGAAESIDIQAELEVPEETTKSKVKKTKKAKKTKADVKPAAIDRFFNDYGESPHLQAIETSYLRYLEA
jgi:hypothetical protein